MVKSKSIVILLLLLGCHSENSDLKKTSSPTTTYVLNLDRLTEIEWDGRYHPQQLTYKVGTVQARDLDPKVMAFLDMICVAEGSCRSDNGNQCGSKSSDFGYKSLYGCFRSQQQKAQMEDDKPHRFASYTQHPRIRVKRAKGSTETSSASGKYQIKDDVHESALDFSVKILGNYVAGVYPERQQYFQGKDFSSFDPVAQDHIALYYLIAIDPDQKEKDWLKHITEMDLENPDQFQEVVWEMSRVWASFPTRNATSKYEQPVHPIESLWELYTKKLLPVYMAQSPELGEQSAPASAASEPIPQIRKTKK